MSTRLESGDAPEPSLDAAFGAIARRVVPEATTVQHHRLEGGISETFTRWRYPRQRGCSGW